MKIFSVLRNMSGTGVFMRLGLIGFSILAAFCVCSCNSSRVSVLQETAEMRIREPILLIPPLSSNLQYAATCDTLGTYYSVELPKRVKGQVIYAKNIDTLKDLATWNNLVKNGTVDAKEAAVMAKSANCDSALTVQLLSAQLYPPFRMVVSLQWVDAETGNVIGRLYQDVDLTDSETKYRFRNFVGQGPAKEIYEKFSYSEGLYQSASLMPEEFKRFVAAYSSTLIFGEISNFPWWMFWRSF